MTLADDIAGDWSVFDGVETVSLTPQNPPAAAVTGVKAMRRALTRREVDLIEMTGGVQVSDLCWSLWDATLGGTEPQVGDLITDGGGQDWSILVLELTTLGTRWRALTRKV